MGKRYAVLAGLISLLATTLSWQLMDDEILPHDSFFEKLIIGVGVVIATFMITRMLIGKKEEGVHL